MVLEKNIVIMMVILEYEGEFKNGKRHGNGKEYDNKGDLIFDGEYNNGLKWNGKGFDEHGNIKY